MSKLILVQLRPLSSLHFYIRSLRQRRNSRLEERLTAGYPDRREIPKKRTSIWNPMPKQRCKAIARQWVDQAGERWAGALPPVVQ